MKQAMEAARMAVPALLLVVAGLLLGGSSQGIYASAGLQLLASLYIAWAAVTENRHKDNDERTLLVLLGAVLALCASHLVPVPFAIWAMLPGHAEPARALALAGADGGWRPLGLDPLANIAAMLAILPVIAAALVGARMSSRALRPVFAAIVAVTAGSVLLGMLQRLDGLESPLYIYPVSNRGWATGFFANSNHLATLCAISIPLATALFVARRGATRPSARWLILGIIVLWSLIGVYFTNSLAGAGLSVLGLASVLFIARLNRARDAKRVAAIALLGLVAVLALGGVLLFANVQLLDEQAAQGNGMGRPDLWSVTLRGIWAFFPLGAGIGAYRIAYPRFEDPAVVTNVFANHAHNDLLEILFEGGVPAAILLVLFLLWWGRTAFAIWRAPVRDAAAEAATVASAIILLHSLVDYPLRTGAIAILFGLCLGIMARPRRVAPDAEDPTGEAPPQRATRHLAA